MKKLMMILCSLLLLSCAADHAQEFYVSPDGDDSFEGTADRPFATVGRAQEAVRGLADRNVDVKVIFRGGTYVLKDKVRFSVADSAPEGSTYSYEAFPGETPVFTSAVPFDGWSQVPELPEGMDPALAGKVYSADIPEGLEAPFVLFNGEEMIYRARKTGFEICRMKPVRDGNPEARLKKNEFHACRSMNVYHAKDRHLLKEFTYKDPQGLFKDWDEQDAVEIGFAPVPWVLNILPVGRVDLEHRKVFMTRESNSPAGIRNGPTEPWIENALEYLAPGTFVARQGKVYYCKAGDEDLSQIRMPSMIEYVIVEGEIDPMGEDVPVRNLAFRGLTFQEGNRYTWGEDHKGWGIQHDWDKYDAPNALFRFRGAENCTVEGCRFTRSGGSALRLDLYCQNITVTGNLIDYVGHMGILLCGYGPGTKDVNKNNEITNNVIHHVGQIIYNGAAIFLWQSGGNRVAHNLMHHIPRKAVGVCGVRMPILIKDWCDWDEASKTIRWQEVKRNPAYALFAAGEISLTEYWKTCLPFLHARNNVVEFNEVHHALERLADGAILNVSGAGTGNVVRQNYVHHIVSDGSGGMRTDDWQCNTLFEKNIIQNSNIPGNAHKGFNDVVNNIFIDCNPNSYILFGTYPDEAPAYHSLIQKNIFYETEFKNPNFYYVRPNTVSQGIARPHNCNTDYNMFFVVNGKDAVARHLEKHRASGIEAHSVEMDPGFVPSDGVVPFRIPERSPVWEMGFEPIDMDHIGLDVENYPERWLEAADMEYDRTETVNRHEAKYLPD